jgi:predicted permease
MLLGSAGLMVKMLRNLQTLDPGFDRDHIVTFSVDPRIYNYTPQQTKSLREQLVNRVCELPGVVGAGISSRPLMRGTGFKTTISAPGQSTPPSDFMNTSLNGVRPEYFETMGLRFVAGRNYTATETDNTKPVRRIVNQRFAQRFFPGLDPIGQTFGIRGDSQIIGIVSDAKYRSLREPIQPTIYTLLDANPEYAYEFTLNVRTRGRPEALIEPVRQALRSIDPNLPFHEIRTLADDVEISLWNERTVARISVLLGVFSAVVTGTGIFALLAYVVVQRTREIGIRMAVGATPANVLGLVARQSLAFVFTGLCLGLIGLLAAGQWISALLYGVQPRDSLAMLVAVLFIISMGAIATLSPAIRAVRIEPAVALRQD